MTNGAAEKGIFGKEYSELWEHCYGIERWCFRIRSIGVSHFLLQGFLNPKVHRRLHCCVSDRCNFQLPQRNSSSTGEDHRKSWTIVSCTIHESCKGLCQQEWKIYSWCSSSTSQSRRELLWKSWRRLCHQGPFGPERGKEGEEMCDFFKACSAILYSPKAHFF